MATFRGPHTQITGFVATGDQSANQYRAVKPGSTAGTVKLAVATTDKIIGLLINDPTTGKDAAIIGHGNAVAKVVHNVAAGDFLSPNTTGNLKTITAGRAVARALEASTKTGDIIAVFVDVQKV
jgi:hypothetical protein